MEIKFIGAAREVTGSKHLITTRHGKKILLDCGMFQGRGDTEAQNYKEFAYNPAEIGLVVVSQRETQRYLLFDRENRLCGWSNIATGEFRGPIAKSQEPIAHRQLAFSGMQVLNPRIFEVMDKVVEEKGEKFSLIDLYLSIAEKEILRAFIPENYRMMDVGKINQLSEAEAFAQEL